MEALILECLVPIFSRAALIATFMGIASKVINMTIKAFTRGEIVV